MKKLLSIIIITLLLLTSCQKPKVNQDKITIVASFFPLYDFAKKVGGDYVEVTNLIPDGASTHGYELSVKDKILIEEADLFIYNGANLETFLPDLLKSLKNSDVELLNTTASIKLLELIEAGHDHFDTDPHVWLNPNLAKIQMEEIVNKLSEIDPNNKKAYENNYLIYSNKFDELDEKFKNLSSYISHKNILVSHQAFSYFTEAYGINQKSIFGFSDEGEPTIGQILEAIGYIKEHELKVIFVDKHSEVKIATTIINEVKDVFIATLNPLEIVTKEEIDNGADYFSLMEENLDVLTKYLGDEDGTIN